MSFHKLVSGINDLRSWCMSQDKLSMLDEWNYEKNIGLDPSFIAIGSERKVWWKCSQGHEWKAQIKCRTKQNTGCPYCFGRRVIAGISDLQTKFPEVAKEWQPTKNGELKPTDVMGSSNIKVWWLCAQNHSYEAKIDNRTQLHRGCPYCSGRKLLQGYNDFETWCKQNDRQDLLEEWNYERNHGLKPNEILYGGAEKKYWWKGSCGHEWDSVISSRVRVRQGKTGIVKTAGCPYCSNPPKRVLVGFNDLETWCKNKRREIILNEWNYERNDLKPNEVTYASGKSVWWKCNKNHEWRTQVSCRTSGSKTNCPVCARTQTSFPEQALAYYLMKEYDIFQRYRVAGREVDIFIPKYNIAVEYDGARWHSGEDKKSKDEEKEQKIIRGGVRLIRIRENSDNNEILNRAGRQIIEFKVHSGKYLTSDFEWAVRELFKLINSLSGQTGLPSINMARDEFEIRAHYMNVLKDNSAASVFPELIEEWDIEKNNGITPESFSARTRQKVWWKCRYGHAWRASINTRGAHKLGCPYCAGQKVIYGENDFETWCKNNNPKLLEKWDYEKNELKPNEIPRTYKEKLFWKCDKGHAWQATVYNRVNGTGCPICNTGNNVKRNQLTLKEWCLNNNSGLCDEWNYAKNGELTPENVSYGSHAKIWWKCSKGHEWRAVVKSRTYNHGCPYCSGTNKRALKGVNDLETWCKTNDREYILSEWNADKNGELLPNMVTWGSHKRVFWKCSKGHEWEAVIKERTKLHGNMCPICKKNGESG